MLFTRNQQFHMLTKVWACVLQRLTVYSTLKEHDMSYLMLQRWLTVCYFKCARPLFEKCKYHGGIKA